MPLSPDDAVIATYYIETNQSLDAVARAIAETETTGRWSGPGAGTTLFHECQGEVYAVREQGPGRGEIDLLFPLVNMNIKEAAFPSLWLTLVGGGTHALLAYEKSRVVDFRLPSQALALSWPKTPSVRKWAWMDMHNSPIMDSDRLSRINS
jgi:ribulose 1,5-bisphosphate carboxylase large subunit-like protein